MQGSCNRESYFASGAVGAASTGDSAGAAAAGAAGSVAVCSVGAAFSKMLFSLLSESKVRVREVTKKIAAITLVNRVNKFAPPEVPNTV